MTSSDPYFDAELGSWMVSRFEHVVAALREPRLLPRGASGKMDVAHHIVREAAALSLSPERVASWRDELAESALRMVADLPEGERVDLVASFAAPWSLSLALRVTGVDAVEAPQLSRLADEVFLESARSTPRSEYGAAAATSELAEAFVSGGIADVQTFVAISRTLPCLMAAAWLELFSHAEQAARLRRHPELLSNAIEELLRLTSAARAVFRDAAEDLTLGPATIRRGERVALLLASANRDPARFALPATLDFQRQDVSHLSFGRGIHSCSGARLVRMAMEIATQALLSTKANVEVVGEVDWLEGFAIRGPLSLPVRLGARGF